jgi:hypothetical protein
MFVDRNIDNQVNIHIEKLHYNDRSIVRIQHTAQLEPLPARYFGALLLIAAALKRLLLDR